MTLPDPETTDAESVTVPTEDVLEQIDDDNPFKATIESLREDGESWESIWNTLEDVYNPVDKATAEEMSVLLPEYRIKAVVHDEQSTSGERYETFTAARATEDKAIEWVEGKPGVRRVESTEQIGTVTVS